MLCDARHTARLAGLGEIPERHGVAAQAVKPARTAEHVEGRAWGGLQRQGEAVAHVAFAPTLDRQVDRETQRLVAVGGSAPEEIRHEVAVA